MYDEGVYSNDEDEVEVVDVTDEAEEWLAKNQGATDQQKKMALLRIMNTHFIEGKHVAFYGNVYQPGPNYYAQCN